MKGALPDDELLSRVISKISAGIIAFIEGYERSTHASWNHSSVTYDLGVREEYVYDREGNSNLID